MLTGRVGTGSKGLVSVGLTLRVPLSTIQCGLRSRFPPAQLPPSRLGPAPTSATPSPTPLPAPSPPSSSRLPPSSSSSAACRRTPPAPTATPSSACRPSPATKHPRSARRCGPRSGPALSCASQGALAPFERQPFFALDGIQIALDPQDMSGLTRPSSTSIRARGDGRRRRPSRSCRSSSSPSRTRPRTSRTCPRSSASRTASATPPSAGWQRRAAPLPAGLGDDLYCCQSLCRLVADLERLQAQPTSVYARGSTTSPTPAAGSGPACSDARAAGATAPTPCREPGQFAIERNGKRTYTNTFFTLPSVQAAPGGRSAGCLA